MIDRFVKNKIAINLLGIEHNDLPKFSAEQWKILASIRSVLAPINEATQLLQDRTASISIIIPLFKVLFSGKQHF